MKDDGFIRQENNKGAVLNIDNNGVKMYKAQRDKQLEINTMKEEISEIRKLLRELVNKDK